MLTSPVSSNLATAKSDGSLIKWNLNTRLWGYCDKARAFCEGIIPKLAGAVPQEATRGQQRDKSSTAGLYKAPLLSPPPNSSAFSQKNSLFSIATFQLQIICETSSNISFPNTLILYLQIYLQMLVICFNFTFLKINI